MNLIRQAYSDIFSSNEDILVGYLSGVQKCENNGCVLYLNFLDPTADATQCSRNQIPMEGIHVYSSTKGYSDLYNEADLMVGDIIVALVEDDIGPDYEWMAKRIMKVDKGLFGVFLQQMKALDPKLVSLDAHQ